METPNRLRGVRVAGPNGSTGNTVPLRHFPWREFRQDTLATALVLVFVGTVGIVAAFGQSWTAKTVAKPLYTLSKGQTSTTFKYRDFTAAAVADSTVMASVTVTNTGAREGADAPQLHLANAPDGRRAKLLAVQPVALRPGESRRLTFTVNPRLLARFDGTKQQWRIDAGTYAVVLSRAADAPLETRAVHFTGRVIGR